MDDMVTCPYEKSHRIHKSRLQYHLVKCKKQHTTVKKIICPLNNCHLVNSSEIQEHLKTCSSLSNLIQDDIEENVNIAPIVDVEITRPKEDWDREPAPGPSYNAMEIAANKNVLRCMIGLSKAERKKFRDAERLRIENMSGIAIGKPPPAKDMTNDMPIRPPSVIPEALIRNTKTTQKNFDTNTQKHELKSNIETKHNHKRNNSPEKSRLAERLSKASSQSSKNVSSVDLLNSSSTKSVKDISIKNTVADNHNADVTYKSINDSWCLNDGKENSSVYDNSKKMSAKEKQKDSITEANLDWQSNYLRNLGIGNLKLKEEETFEAANTSHGQINDNSFNISKIMSSTKYARSVDEAKQSDQMDRNSGHNVVKLNEKLTMLTDIETRIAKEKARISKELNNLKKS